MLALESLHNIRVPHTSKAQKETPNVLTSVGLILTIGLLVQVQLCNFFENHFLYKKIEGKIN
jgi:hypothetical protein